LIRFARRPRANLSSAIGAAALVLVLLGAQSAQAKRAVIEVRTVKVGNPDNRSVGVVPFTDAIYRNCADAPSGSSCEKVGKVGYRYDIGELEVTVDQWVDFLNTTDPRGRNKHRLHARTQSSKLWPQYGQVNRKRKANKGRHYSVATPEWSDKPFGFADFFSAARFVNSLYNGRVLKREKLNQGGFKYRTYRVKLSPKTQRGMYDLSNRKAARTDKTGFVVPSQDEWIKAAYYDRGGGGTFSYWKYPTNPGVFGDGDATAPSSTSLDFSTGDVTNSGTQPLAQYRAAGQPAPSWCPPGAQTGPSTCSTQNPFGINPTTYVEIYAGVVGAVGQAGTTSPWGTLDQGGNAVEWTDTFAPPPAGSGGGKVWRRLHGGVSNAPGFQMWPSAVGLQPQDNQFFEHVYPWLGIRVGAIGNLRPAR